MSANKADKLLHTGGALDAPVRLSRKDNAKKLRRLQIEPLRLEESIRRQGQRIIVIFEGRDSAGKGGTIKRIAAMLNPRFCQVVALAAPTERERTQWYFQRYVAHLPSAGEMVLFGRNWYNRAGVEHVTGFCSEAEYEEFMARVRSSNACSSGPAS